jgi:MFS family permease
MRETHRYGTVLLRQAGFETPRDASIANLGIGVLKALSTIGAMLLVDRYGRRRLLLVGTFMMVLSLIVLASVLTAYPPPESDAASNAIADGALAPDDGDVGHVRRGGDAAGSGGSGGSDVPNEVKWTTLGSLAAYVCAFSFSYGPVVWLVLAETFPDDIRARAMAVSVCVWGGGLLCPC